MISIIIGLSGLAGAGKDTAADYLVNELGFIRVALANPVRDMLYLINPIIDFNDHNEPVRLQFLVNKYGWDYIKRYYKEARELMQRCGTEMGRNYLHPNFWINLAMERHPDLTWADTKYVITDVRFKNEAEFVNAYGGLIWVDRPGIVRLHHSSESGEVKNLAKLVAINDGSIDDLHEQLKKTVEILVN